MQRLQPRPHSDALMFDAWSCSACAEASLAAFFALVFPRLVYAISHGSRV